MIGSVNDEGELLATVENMRAVEDRIGVFAFSPTTSEEYSATPGDYWDAAPDEALLDANGDPMVLVIRTSHGISLTAEDALE